MRLCFVFLFLFSYIGCILSVPSYYNNELKNVIQRLETEDDEGAFIEAYGVAKEAKVLKALRAIQKKDAADAVYVPPPSSSNDASSSEPARRPRTRSQSSKSSSSSSKSKSESEEFDEPFQDVQRAEDIPGADEKSVVYLYFCNAQGDPFAAFNEFVKNVFYIGIGTRRRPIIHIGNAINGIDEDKKMNPFMIEKIKQCWDSENEVNIVIAYECISRVECLEREASMIYAINQRSDRVAKQLGHLANLHSGYAKTFDLETNPKPKPKDVKKRRENVFPIDFASFGVKSLGIGFLKAKQLKEMKIRKINLFYNEV